MTMQSWPVQERPSEKLLLRGVAALSDAELLAVLLRTGLPGVNAVELARNWLGHFGDLRRLLEASPPEIQQVPGLGRMRQAQLLAVLELGRRYLEQPLRRGDALESAADTRLYVRAQLHHQPNEVFACLFLDNRHRVLAYEELFQGTIDSASVHPRQVIRRALHHNAAALILAHNHPSGIAEPSSSDRLITRRLQEAALLIDVRVLDHLIVGEGVPFSFAENGLMH